MSPTTTHRPPNFGLGYDQRPLVARTIRAGLSNVNADGYTDDERKALTAIAERLDRPGPPIVSAADIFDIVDFILKLESLLAGEHVDHQWAFVRLEDDSVISEHGDRHFLVAQPGQSGARGNLRITKPAVLASELYEQHLAHRGLVPTPA